ncbi:MAG TPA: Gfo/Idh/MocA family oxidoreductase [bacterium]|nr:Gfo/Idh/MocA family oxidoreductase [bacterium]
MIRVGVAGCGRIAEYHLRALKEIPDFRVTAVCDIIPDRAAAAAKTLTGAKTYTSYRDMVAAADVDLVDICTPSGLHPEIGIVAAQAGKHVVTEKPMAVRLADADALIAACSAAQVKLFVVKQNRLNTTMQLLKRALDRGRFGRIFMANATVRWQRPQSYYDSAPWRGTWALDGGAFMNQASHYVDSLVWLMGPAANVYALTATYNHQIEAEDSGSAVIRFASGAIGTFEVTMCAYPKNLEGSVTIIGEKGTVKIGGIAINRFETWQFADYDDDDGMIYKSNYEPPNVYGFGHLAYFNNVAATLRGEATAGTDGDEGRKSLELICAMYQSARTGQPVNL